MDYVVLARKLRPQRFQDLVGQEMAARALRNAIRTGRLAHAYLFAGSRGVGKTTTARILTKAFNCLDPQDGEPCNACEHCIEIGANASPDVFEIDAASNRGIDNIRELRENTKYAPAKCRYKTYIIDEVHMLTQESFNALLKTLEEPPAHVKFILATTHPHRIPETILSRCQRFDFARIPLGRMVDYLERATAAEGLSLSRGSLESMARNSAGGMRDALTMVDQVVAYAGPKPSDEDVQGLLQLLNHGEVQALFEAILARSLDGALDSFGSIVSRGHELRQVLEALLREVKDLTLYTALGGEHAYFADHLRETLEFYERRKDAATLDQLQQTFQVLLDLEGQLRSSAHARACFEMALIKACGVQPLVGVPELLARARDLLRPGAGAVGTLQGRSAPPARPATPAGRASEQARPALRAGQPARRSAPAPESGPEEEPEPPRPVAASARTPPPAPAAPMVPPGEEAAVPHPLLPVADNGGAHAEPAAPSPAAIGTSASPADEGDDPERDAPCDDARWLALARAVDGKSRRLAADLRGTEVLRIEGETVEAAVRGKPLSPPDLALLEEEGRRAFGAAFRLRWIDATREAYRAHRSVAGRKRWREERGLAQERADAEADPSVEQVRRFFPNSKVVQVRLADSEAAAPPEDPARR